MSSKAKLFPLSSTGEVSRGLPLRSSWGKLLGDSKDIDFLRSWIVYDSAAPSDSEPARSNWNLVLGLAVAVVISASFWTGIGLVVTRAWK
jgi:hypothetical protein